MSGDGFPAQADYRAQPAAGDAAGHAARLDHTSRDDPNAGGAAVSPQPQLPGAGYSLNALPAAPNRMQPSPAGPPWEAGSPPGTSLAGWEALGGA